MTLSLPSLRSVSSPAAFALAAALLAFATISQAQYKVIGADGKVTYTDREPTATEGRVSPLGARAASAQAEAELPFDLRGPASKYPVTLYTATGACEPCTQARTLLKQRGIPFNERQVVSTEDSDALEHLAGSRELPTLTIGSQSLRGLNSDNWNAYLDAAGYPRESKLPSSYQYRAATPVVERRDTAATRSAEPATPARPTGTPGTPLPAGAGGIRF